MPAWTSPRRCAPHADAAGPPSARADHVNGRKAVFVGGHCTGVAGASDEDGHDFAEVLYAHVTQPKYIHRHQWVEGDIVIWENRCALHAATPLETDRYRRDMRRATVNESGEEIDAHEYRRRIAASDRTPLVAMTTLCPGATPSAPLPNLSCGIEVS